RSRPPPRPEPDLLPCSRTNSAARRPPVRNFFTAIKGSLTFAHHPQAAVCRPRAGSVTASRRSSPRLPPPMERGPLRLLPRASHPAVTHDARGGGDRPSRTDPSTTPSTSVEPQRRLPLSLMHPHFAPIRRLLPAPPRGPCQRAQAPTATRPDR